MTVVERTYTRAQLRFRGTVPQVDPAVAKAAAAAPQTASNVPIAGIANTGIPMPDWFGSVALNLSGMRLRQDLGQRALPLLFEHFSPIGFVTSLAVDATGLRFQGQVIPAVEAATDALALAAGGYPWQCSLYAEPTVVRELAPGEHFAVNGHEMVGPGVVFEEWWLGEVSLTAQGRDPMTSAGLAASKEGDAVRLSVEVRKMAEQDPPKPPANGGNADGGEAALTVEQIKAKYPTQVAELEKAAYEKGMQKGMDVQKEVDAEIADAAHETVAGGETEAAKQSPEAQVAAVAASAIRAGKPVKSVFAEFLKLGRAVAGRGATVAPDPRAARQAAIDAANRREEPTPNAPPPPVDNYAQQFAALTPEEQAKWGKPEWFAAHQRAAARGQIKRGWTPPPKATAAAGGAN